MKKELKISDNNLQPLKANSPIDITDNDEHSLNADLPNFVNDDWIAISLSDEQLKNA